MKLYGRPAQAAAIRSRKARGFSVFKAGNWPPAAAKGAQLRQPELFDDSPETAEEKAGGGR
jgi:hypothetical protein